MKEGVQKSKKRKINTRPSTAPTLKSQFITTQSVEFQPRRFPRPQSYRLSSSINYSKLQKQISNTFSNKSIQRQSIFSLLGKLSAKDTTRMQDLFFKYAIGVKGPSFGAVDTGKIAALYLRSKSKAQQGQQTRRALKENIRRTSNRYKMEPYDEFYKLTREGLQGLEAKQKNDITHPYLREYESGQKATLHQLSTRGSLQLSLDAVPASYQLQDWERDSRQVKSLYADIRKITCRQHLNNNPRNRSMFVTS